MKTDVQQEILPVINCIYYIYFFSFLLSFYRKFFLLTALNFFTSAFYNYILFCSNQNALHLHSTIVLFCSNEYMGVSLIVFVILVI